MQMTNICKILTIGLCFVLAGCATSTLWENSNPNQSVAMELNEANLKRIQSQGLSYREDPERKLIYAKKTDFQKAQDYIVRILGTPVTVLLDSATVIAVVGVVVYVSSYDIRTSGQLAAEYAEQQKAEAAKVESILEAIRAE